MRTIVWNVMPSGVEEVHRFLEEFTASIFRVGEQSNQTASIK
jgi:hypothetical protein